MTIDGITCSLLANELNDTLKGGRLDKIFQPDRNTVILHIRTLGKVVRLLISIDPAAARVALTDFSPENPAMPPSFCMLLRKYLSGSKIESIENPSCERIIEINLTNTDEIKDSKKFKLTAELMGRFSNLILINEHGKIIDSAVHVDFQMSRVREVMPARIYEYPPAQNKISVAKATEYAENGLLPIISDEIARPVDKALVNSITGLSPLIAKQLCARADVDARKTASMLTNGETVSLCNECCSFFNEITNLTYKPTVYFSDSGTPEVFSITRFVGYKNFKTTDTISQAFDIYFGSLNTANQLESKKRALLKIVDSALDRTTKKRATHQSDLDEGLKADTYKNYGDMILTSQYKITKGDVSATLDDYVNTNEDGTPKQTEVPLNPELSPSANAEEYYKRFRKAKRKTELAKEYLEDDQSTLDYLRSLRAAIFSATTQTDINALSEEITRDNTKKKATKQTNQGDPNKTVGLAKSGKASSRALRNAAKAANSRKKKTKHKDEALPLRLYMTSDGYEVMCGRNNIQNDRLTFSVADKSDWWFHVKGTPGTHVIVKSHPGEEFPSDEAVLFAASTAAYFSKNILVEEHKTADLKCDVDYCPVSHVKKIPGAKPGMVIYEGYYSVTVEAKAPGKDLNEST